MPWSFCCRNFLTEKILGIAVFYNIKHFDGGFNGSRSLVRIKPPGFKPLVPLPGNDCFHQRVCVTAGRDGNSVISQPRQALFAFLINFGDGFKESIILSAPVAVPHRFCRKCRH